MVAKNQVGMDLDVPRRSRRRRRPMAMVADAESNIVRSQVIRRVDARRNNQSTLRASREAGRRRGSEPARGRRNRSTQIISQLDATPRGFEVAISHLPKSYLVSELTDLLLRIGQVDSVLVNKENRQARAFFVKRQDALAAEIQLNEFAFGGELIGVRFEGSGR